MIKMTPFAGFTPFTPFYILNVIFDYIVLVLFKIREAVKGVIGVKGVN